MYDDKYNWKDDAFMVGFIGGVVVIAGLLMYGIMWLFTILLI